MKTEFTIEQIRTFVSKGYRSVAARMTKSAMDHMDDWIERTAPPVKVNMKRGAILEGITHRILSERRKHQDTMPGPDAWAKIAAHKIVSEHIDHLLDQGGELNRDRLLESINEAEKHDLFNSLTEYFKGCRDGVKASTTEPIKPIMSRLDNEEYMAARKIIKGFVQWQLEHDMVDPLTIGYEVAEMYLDEKVPDLSGLDKKSKDSFVNDFVEMTAKNVLSVFVALGLETHLEVTVINDADGNEYKLSFKKA